MFACHYRRTIRLRAPVASAFAFHLNPANLRQISPPWTPVHRVQVPATFAPGAQLEVEVRVFGFWPQTWKVEIKELAAPERLVDIALSGPFPAWRHTHSFRSVGTETEMTDQVDYDPPLGWLGRCLDPLVTRPLLALMFRFRHRRTKALLESAEEPLQNPNEH